ncbi:hypothetical protein HAX54_031140 [Datura stramonium]|uniref:Uncharacterized protein n=1 Tax=Datura stramonium TaxID=4076 RepID=A0ABS8VAR9_DATST|nr:hypothetical protein [Datura stramonium]
MEIDGEVAEFVKMVDDDSTIVSKGVVARVLRKLDIGVAWVKGAVRIAQCIRPQSHNSPSWHYTSRRPLLRCSSYIYNMARPVVRQDKHDTLLAHRLSAWHARRKRPSSLGLSFFTLGPSFQTSLRLIELHV